MSDRVKPDQSGTKREWHFRGRWALVPLVIGILIVSFVAATGGKYGAWLLWIAVPLLMISLGYIYLVNAFASLMAISARTQELREEEEKRREG